ncbi:MAG TPA: hypothetical protein VFC21_08265 [Bryobacteraceae bacterium]|nr:hypothetical protein [Bryobacteraceae bacterium]
MFRIALYLLPLALIAQQEPVRIAYGCPADELQNAGLLCTEDEPCPIYLEINAITAAGKRILIAGDIHATAATLSSVLLSSEDGGLTWKEPAARITGTALDQVQALDADHAWAAGETQYPLTRDPYFLITTDGGASWRRRDVTEDGGPGSVLRFWFDSDQHGELIVDGGRSAPGGRYSAYESETGGESWMIRSTTDQLPKLRRAAALTDNSDYRVQAMPGGKAYAIEKRTGETWQPIALMPIEIANCKVKAPEAKEPQPETEQPPAKDYVEELKLGSPAAKTSVPPAKKGPGN